MFSGQCSRPKQERLSIMDCCCDGSSAGWGDGIGAACEICPTQGSGKAQWVISYNTIEYHHQWICVDLNPRESNNASDVLVLILSL